MFDRFMKSQKAVSKVSKLEISLLPVAGLNAFQELRN